MRLAPSILLLVMLSPEYLVISTDCETLHFEGSSKPTNGKKVKMNLS